MTEGLLFCDKPDSWSFSKGSKLSSSQQPLRRCAPAPLAGEPNIGAIFSRETAPKPPLLGEQRTAALATCESPSPRGWRWHGGVVTKGLLFCAQPDPWSFSKGSKLTSSRQPLRRCAPAPLAGEPWGNFQRSSFGAMQVKASPCGWRWHGGVEY